MFALLSPRLWIALALAGALAFSHFYAYRKGSAHVTAEWNLDKARANSEARQIENLRQSRVDESAKLASARQAGIRADSTRVGDAVSGLRNAIATRDLAEESAVTATKRADSLGKLLVQGAEAHRELAERCDRHVSDLRMLLEAWPR